MNNLNKYIEQLFSFNNPIFFAGLLTLVVIIVLIMVYIRVIYPLQKKFVAENQRYLLEKAELMALFAEMDPDPLLRVNIKGEIVHTNESTRKLFTRFNLSGGKIREIIPSYTKDIENTSCQFIATIDGRIYNINVTQEEKLGFSNFYLHDITEIKEYERKLESYKGNLINLSAELDRRYEELKSSISSELHDDLGQKMIVVKLKMNKLDKYSVDEILKDLESIYLRIREISHTLSPLNTSNLGIELTLQSMIQNLSKASGIKGSLDVYKESDNINVDLDKNIEKCIISTVQEALNNVVKHSQAREFQVALTFEEERVVLVISDNGIGIKEEVEKFTVSNKQGIGLFRMKEKIQNLGGKFSIFPGTDYKTNLIAKLPRRSINQ
jgi:signal transduction histidine kinase